METIFSRLLVQLRKEAGFPTAYKFYHDTGGKGVLKMSYRAYLMAEQGRILPELGRLGVFIWALGLTSKSVEANAFVSAWLKTMAGEDNFKDLVEPLLAAAAAAAAPGLSPMQKAVKKSMAAQKYHLTVEQAAAIYASHDNYLCYLAMSNDTGAWGKKEFAARLSLKEPVAEKALKALAAVKIVKEVKKGVYKCPLAGRIREFPHMGTLPEELRKKIHSYDNELEATGQRAFVCRSIIRADEVDLHNYFPIVEVNVSTAETYSVNEKTGHSALFMVEGKVTKLRDF
ncbi:MAG TPA: hypothetical protein DCZ92_00620 [Elusimicrobia bacterium]|nr:MAG: hypothetical protein A2016_09925 [Elusimicrobia bacterium GWF2_62_30]HBA59329.1 hypothetical protein [Elusimicrobiota bacterium]